MRVLSSLLSKRPVVISLVCIVVMLVMIVGATKMKLATGNETLMSTGSEVYQDNEKLEKYFGGESIILLSTSQHDNGILTVGNLRRMKELDSLLGNYEEVYSVVSPVGLVEQLTSKQFEKMNDNLADATTGLLEMSAKLTEIAENMMKILPNPETPNLLANQNELADKLAVIGAKLAKVASEGTFINPDDPRSLKEIQMMTDQLVEKFRTMSGGNTQPSAGTQTQEIDQLASRIETMGEKLLHVGDGLETLTSHNNIVHSGLPDNRDTLNELLYEQGELRPIFHELILNGRQSVMMVKLKGQIDDQEKNKIIHAIKEQLKKSPFAGVDTIVTGKPVMDAAVHDSMQSGMEVMIGIAVFAMLIVLSFVFRVRWRIIAIPIILLAVFATLGLMGHVGIPMTMVSMAVFPILIGLGVDYAIQFQNRYEEENKPSHQEQGEG